MGKWILFNLWQNCLHSVYVYVHVANEGCLQFIHLFHLLIISCFSYMYSVYLLHRIASLYCHLTTFSRLSFAPSQPFNKITLRMGVIWSAGLKKLPSGAVWTKSISRTRSRTRNVVIIISSTRCFYWSHLLKYMLCLPGLLSLMLFHVSAQKIHS